MEGGGSRGETQIILATLHDSCPLFSLLIFFLKQIQNPPSKVCRKSLRNGEVNLHNFSLVTGPKREKGKKEEKVKLSKWISYHFLSMAYPTSTGKHSGLSFPLCSLVPFFSSLTKPSWPSWHLGDSTLFLSGSHAQAIHLCYILIAFKVCSLQFST